MKVLMITITRAMIKVIILIPSIIIKRIIKILITRLGNRISGKKKSQSEETQIDNEYNNINILLNKNYYQ